jgi:hypothetical protein
VSVTTTTTTTTATTTTTTTTTKLIIKASHLPWYTILAKAGVVINALYLCNTKFIETKHEKTCAERSKLITDAMDIEKRQKKERVTYFTNFYVSLNVHLSITLANDQIDAQIFSTFITILYMYMFRAISCSSSGGQIILTQHLVSSLSVSDRSVHMLRKNYLTS